MTDKVQKIKDWISKEQEGLMDAQGNFEYPEHEGAYHILCNLDAYIDSLPNEPVSKNFEMALAEMIDKAQKCVVEPWVVAAQWKDELIELAKSEEPISKLWHDAYNEQPTCCTTVVTWNPVTRSGEVIHNVASVNRGYLWAYMDDLPHRQKEPVSEDLDRAAEKYAYELFPSIGAANTETELAFKAGAQWQKLKIIYKAIIYNDKIYPTTYEDAHTEFCLDGGEEVRLITEAVNNGLLKQGDKVKVIIIKDE